ncbi:maker527 [Drosophila busckii]|uniref:Maker527 n=1 Tax=Drosophila busckii TaxID=30019 RepID=A0A0M3QU12_DROBS|nr:C-type lectin 37Db [Drosophila busckii]ALC39829.1 maker527 [Drosophila busckii]
MGAVRIQLSSVRPMSMMHKLNLIVFFLLLWQFANSMSTFNSTTKLDDPQIGVVKSAERATNFPIQIGNKFYHLETEGKLNWFEAANKCRELGGYLVNIESSEEMDVLVSLLPDKDIWCWTSAHCLAGNRKFISATTGEPMPYMRWHAGEPNNSAEREFCVEIKAKVIALNDAYCKAKRNYICQAKTV